MNQKSVHRRFSTRQAYVPPNEIPLSKPQFKDLRWAFPMTNGRGHRGVLSPTVGGTIPSRRERTRAAARIPPEAKISPVAPLIEVIRGLELTLPKIRPYASASRASGLRAAVSRRLDAIDLLRRDARHPQGPLQGQDESARFFGPARRRRRGGTQTPSRHLGIGRQPRVPGRDLRPRDRRSRTPLPSRVRCGCRSNGRAPSAPPSVGERALEPGQGFIEKGRQYVRPAGEDHVRRPAPDLHGARKRGPSPRRRPDG